MTSRLFRLKYQNNLNPNSKPNPKTNLINLHRETPTVNISRRKIMQNDDVSLVDGNKYLPEGTR